MPFDKNLTQTIISIWTRIVQGIPCSLYSSFLSDISVMMRTTSKFILLLQAHFLTVKTYNALPNGWQPTNRLIVLRLKNIDSACNIGRCIEKYTATRPKDEIRRADGNFVNRSLTHRSSLCLLNSI